MSLIIMIYELPPATDNKHTTLPHIVLYLAISLMS